MTTDTDSTNHGWDSEMEALMEVSSLDDQLTQQHLILHHLMIKATEFVPKASRGQSDEELAASATLMMLMTAQHLAPEISKTAEIQKGMFLRLKRFGSHESLDSPLNSGHLKSDYD